LILRKRKPTMKKGKKKGPAVGLLLRPHAIERKKRGKREKSVLTPYQEEGGERS